MFSEKEHFILSAQSQLFQAVFALYAYKLKENLSLYDSILALSCESLKVHIDNFSEYALSLGK